VIKKTSRKLRVFHGLVNYGTQSGYIAKGLRTLNVNAKSFINNDPYGRETDYMFSLRTNLSSKIYNRLIRIWCIFYYDIFHFYYGTSLWHNHKDLHVIKFLNKKIVHHYLGHDVELYKETKEKYEFSNMDFWADDIKGKAHDIKIKKRLKNELKYSDTQIVCAPQYSPFVPSSTFIPLAIDLSKFQFSPLPIKNFDSEPVTIVHAPTHRGVKGTQFLIEAVERLQKEGYLINLNICEGITHDQLLKEYKKADFSVASLLGGWFGTVGIEAMATGRGIISFLREEYLGYVESDYRIGLPVVSADKYSIYSVLKDVRKKRDYKKWGEESRLFVEKYHDMKVVAQKVLHIYDSIK
jgi:glycosyltransferase involved in cell wall biosynthesis